MHVIVLGSGVASGLPGWNDGSEASLRARANDRDVPRREGAALAVSADGERYSLLEAPLHLASTLTRIKRFAPPASTRAAPIDSLVLTSGDLDACAGALAFGGGLSIRIVSSMEVRAALLEHDAAFGTLEPVWTGFPWDRPFPLDREERLEARLFPLPGPVPDHLRELAPRAGRGRCGVRITDRRTGSRLVWAPRIARFDSATLAELRAADLRFVDGTIYDGAIYPGSVPTLTSQTISDRTPDRAPDKTEARQLRPNARRVEDLGHLPIDGRAGSLAWLSGMSGESIYVHMAGANPLCDTRSEASERVRNAGVGIAFDAMELER